MNKKKLLIVEDEVLILRSLQSLLTKRGAEVDGVTNGVEAIKLIREGNYDRVICDLMLKDITGFEVIEETKNYLNDRSLSDTFIIITAYSSEQILERASKYGCPVLSKPFEDMSAALKLFLGDEL